MYKFTRIGAEDFWLLLIVIATKLLQSLVCTGMPLDIGGLATYNRFIKSITSSLSFAVFVEERVKA
jgi:hypothetical protein